MSDEEYDVPDLSGDIDWNTIPELSDPTESSLITLQADSLRTSSPSTSQYSWDDLQYDSSFLAELDAIEQLATQVSVNGDSSAHHATVSNDQRDTQHFGSIISLPPEIHHRGCTPPQPDDPKRAEQSSISVGETNLKRKRSQWPSVCDSPRKKGKTRDTIPGSGIDSLVEERMNTYLATFQDEMTCPICCDTFAAAHMGNPCGHTFCGDCGWAWIERSNNNASTCPVCRTVLSSEAPILPNITVDSAVQKHIEALQTNGCEEWKPGGSRYQEWHARKERWKADGANRMKKRVAKRKRMSNPRIIFIDDDDDPDYVPTLDLLLEEGFAEENRRRSRRRHND